MFLALAPSKMRIGEIRFLIEYMPEEPVARAALWSYVGAHYGAFADRLTLRGMGNMGNLMQDACDSKARAQAEAFLVGPLHDALGATRRIAHTIERIDRCIAFHKAEGLDLSAALAALH